MRKRFMGRKVASLALVAAMSASLVACSSNKGTSTGSSGSGEKPETIKFAINVGLKDEDSQKWKAEFERLTGITLDYNGPGSGSQYYTDLDLAYANKTEPDVFNIGDGKLTVYAGKGAIADLTELFNNSSLKDKIDPEVMESITIDGKIYGIPFEQGGGTITYVRQDWLDECGLEAPTNYEEFINMLRAFKEKYPDKIPMTAPALYKDQAFMYLREFYQDANPDFVKVDGQWVDGMSQDNMKDALQRLQDAYTEGLLDLEVLTNTTSTCRDKWYAGDVGVFNYWTGTWATSLENRLQANVPEASVLQLPAIEETTYLKRVPVVTAISSRCDNIEGVFKYFIEYMHDGGEGQLLFESGVENTHYKKEGTTLVQLPKADKPEENYEKAFISPYLRLTELEEDLTINYDERVTASNELLDQQYTQLTITPESATYTKKSADITVLKDEVIGKIVTGAMSVEDGLAYYEKEVAALGMDQIIEELNAK